VLFESPQVLQHVSTPKYRTRVVANTDPYRVPLREGDPLYPPLSERLPVQGLFASILCLVQLPGGDAALLGLPPNATVFFVLNELGWIDWIADEWHRDAPEEKQRA
jgi:hypothetical protein